MSPRATHTSEIPLAETPAPHTLNLKPGDTIAGIGKVDGRRMIHWTDLKVTRPSLAVGDRVRWWEVGRAGSESLWVHGTVLAINVEADKTWVWVRVDGRWPRQTMEAGDLQRVEPHTPAIAAKPQVDPIPDPSLDDVTRVMRSHGG